MPGLDNKLSNIIGTKLPTWVLKQLETRSNKNNQDSRDNDNILYLANKSAWVRLVSSVDIGSIDLNYFKNQVGANLEVDPTFGSFIKPESLAKQYVLFGGTSKYLDQNSYQLRSGLGKDNSYGILGSQEIQDFGYKPMPGITSVTIDTQGRLGSVRAATINFKCWDKYQLDIIDALYFKLGFTMFLEWGHTYFYPSAGNSSRRDPNKILSTELYAIDPFEKGLNKEDIQIKIAQNCRNSEGNYDAMLGIVTNFNFTYTQDGGYDCTLKLMALGVLGDSIRINNAGTLPSILKEEIIQLNNTLIEISKQVSTIQQPPPESPVEGEAANDLLSKLVVGLALDIPDVFPAQYFSDLSEDSISRIAFANNNVDSERAKKRIRGELSKSSNFNKIVTFPYTAKFNIKDIDEYKTLNDKDFSQLDYVIDRDLAYIIGNQNIIIDQNRSYSEISLDIPVLKSRYDASFPNNNKGKSFYEVMFNSEKPGDPTWNGELVKGYSLAIGGIDKTKNYIYGIQYKNSLGKLYYFNIIIDRRFSFNQNGSEKAAGDVPVSFLRDSYNTEVPESTRKELIKKILGDGDKYFGGAGQDILSFDKTYFSQAKGWPDFSYQFNLKTDVTLPLQLQYPNDPKRLINANASIGFRIVFNDSSLFASITPDEQSDVLTAFGQSLREREILRQGISSAETLLEDVEDQKKQEEAIDTQIKQALNYQSTLEIMLRTIQLHALNKAINKTTTPDLEIGRTTYVLNIADPNDKAGGTPFLQQVFSTGIFSKFIQDLVTDPNNKLRDSLYTVDKKMDPYERFQIQSKYGFATSLMGNKEPIESIQSVDFKELLKAYVVPYQINQEIIKGTYTNHPVYIPLGLLLMILNHSCTIYDTKEDMDFQTPLVYVDFNPEMNFCLTNTKHLSTNPWVCLIPFEGSDDDYRKLFNPEILIDGGKSIAPTSGSEQSVPLFKPDSQDYLSGTLPTLKFDKKPAQVTQSPGISSALASVINDIVSSSPYRGKVMNILLNIDYLVDTVQQYSYKDGTNSVYLKSFIEQVLTDINKSLGNFNAFRLSYNDSANTFQIVDDQFVPSLANEEQVTPKSNTTELPLLGKFSIAKNLEIKSEVSSKLSNMLAISANANSENKATLSTNGDPFGFVNTAYKDRYISNRTEVTGSGQRITNNDSIKISAQQFNSSISDFYSKINPSQTSVSHATNYYMDKMTKIKNQEYATRAAAMIPVSVNFTTDGVSGLSMGQAFTVPDKLLPYTYTTRKIPGAPQDHLKNVGFAIVGLTHTIENNQWNTSVRANMIYLKDKTEFTGSVVKVDTRTGAFEINTANDFSVSTQQTNYVAEGKEAKEAAEKYLNRTMTDTEWSQLVAATFAEASENQTERAWVMAVILNRTRTKFKDAETITDTLTRKSQFQAVTGTSANGNKPSDNYVNGPNKSSAASIYGAAVKILESVPKNYLFFTSNNPAAYGEGTDIGFLSKLKSKPGAQIIGKTVFSTTA